MLRQIECPQGRLRAGSWLASVPGKDGFGAVLVALVGTAALDAAPFALVVLVACALARLLLGEHARWHLERRVYSQQAR